MGFGFNLFFVLVLLPGTVILLIFWITTGLKIFGYITGVLWACVIALFILVKVYSLFFDKKDFKREDIYGKYRIDKTKFPGRQANWQYAHYRFEITKNDSFLFYITDKERIIKTYRGKIMFVPEYKARIVVLIDSPQCSLIESEPTLYRTRFTFYYVFHSARYNNVFFRKEDW